MRCITGRVGRSRGRTDEGAGLEVEERVLLLRHEGVQEPRGREADDQGRGETRNEEAIRARISGKLEPSHAHRALEAFDEFR